MSATLVCPPPAANAAGDLDGSPKAGQGAGARHHLERAVQAHEAFREYVQAGMRASADKQRARAMRAMWDYLESLP